MNLQSIVAPVVGVINRPLPVIIRRSIGSETSPDGRRVASYGPPIAVTVQMQSLTFSDITQLNGLNIQGERRAIYLNGSWSGISRPDQLGGDLVTFPDGSVWLVAMVLENWSYGGGWVKLALTRQIDVAS